MPLTDDRDIAALLRASRRIAVVGASAKADRASYGVMRFLIDHGYDVIPVNPVLVQRGPPDHAIHGVTVVPSLADISPPVDLVDMFRNADAAPAVVAEAIAHGAKAIWMQLGVINADAAATAEAAGLTVVMDRCLKLELIRLVVTGPA